MSGMSGSAKWPECGIIGGIKIRSSRWDDDGDRCHPEEKEPSTAALSLGLRGGK